MRQQYRLYRRKNGGRYYIHDDVTGKQDSLHTTDRATALRLRCCPRRQRSALCLPVASVNDMIPFARCFLFAMAPVTN